MNCLGPDRMDLYLEGEMDGTERREFEEHIARCPACREALEDRRVFERALSSLPDIEIPPDFARTVLDRLPASPAPAFAWLASAVIGATALLTALLGYYLSTGESLFGLLASMGRSVLSFVSLAVPLLAKVFSLGRVLIELAGDLGMALMRGLAVFSSLIRPEIFALALLLGLALALLLVLGVRRILFLGDKS
jgi:predicted anti-sigma-YlaC factor YlaD